MEALFSSAVANNTKASSQEVCRELLAILQQYPSGLTPAVIATQLQSALQVQRRRGPKRRAPQQAPTPDSAQDTARARTDQRPLWWSAHTSLNPTPLADCLDGRRRRVVVYAELATPPAQGSSTSGTTDGLPSLAAPSLLLSDGSTPGPVGMFVHSSHLHLVGGPIFEESTRLRASAFVAPPPPGCCGFPPIMPTTQLVVELPEAAWERLGSLINPQYCGVSGSASGSGTAEGWTGTAAAPVRDLVQVLDEHAKSAADPHAGPVPLEGWLVARVVSVGPPEHGGAWGVHTVRTVQVASAAGAGAADAACSTAVLTVPWVLRDDDVALGDLLVPGEVVAAWCASLQPLEAPPCHAVATQVAAAAATTERGPAVAVLLGERSLLVTRMAGATKESAAVVSCPKIKQQQQYTVLPDLASLVPGGEGLVVWGCVQDLRLCGTWRLECTLCAADGGPFAIPLKMQLTGRQRSKALLHQLREGHTLMLVGARSIGSSQQPCDHQKQQQGGDEGVQQSTTAAALEWDESWPGTAVQDITTLPALLTTPALQKGLEAGLKELSAPGATPPQPLAVVQGTIAGAEVTTARVHSACGRPVSRVSLGLGGLDEALLFDGTDGGGEWGGGGGGGGGAAGEADDGIEEEGGDGGGGGAGALWGCSFCRVECGPAETGLVFGGTLRVEADGSVVALAAEAGVFPTLLPFSPEQWRRLHARAAAAQVQRAIAGRACRLCICTAEEAGAAEKKLTVTQVKLL